MMASDEDTVTKFDSLTSLQDWTTDDFINVTTSEVVDFNYTTTISSLNVTGGATKSGSPLRKYDFLNPMWNVSFTISVIIGTLGNFIVLWIVLCHKRMWTSTNYFLVNLSITDLLLTVLNGLFNFIYMRDNNWIFGDIYCTINNFVAYVTVAASVLTLTAITLDRYRAIIYPLRPKLSRWVILGAIIAIWIMSSLLALPTILYSETFSNTKITVCLLHWPDGIAHHSKTDYIYNIVFFLVTYVIPLILMGACYARMGFHLWGTPIIGEETEALRKNYQNKKKVVKMFVIVISVFGLCWLPYHAYFLYTYHNPTVARWPATKHVYLGIYWLAMSNTTVNPIIYYWMNVRFRKYFVRFLLFLPRLFFGKDCFREADRSPGNHSLPPSNRNSLRRSSMRRRDSSRTTLSKRMSSRTSMMILSPQSNHGAKIEDDQNATNQITNETTTLVDTTTDSSYLGTTSLIKISPTLTSKTTHLSVPNGYSNATVKWSRTPDSSNNTNIVSHENNSKIVRTYEEFSDLSSNAIELEPVSQTNFS